MGFFRSSFFRLPRHQQFRYELRYSEKETSQDQEKTAAPGKRIKFERGKALQRARSPIAGQFKTHYVVNKSKTNKAKRYRIMLYLALMIATLYALFRLDFSPIIAIIMILILLILFIRENNKF